MSNDRDDDNLLIYIGLQFHVEARQISNAGTPKALLKVPPENSVPKTIGQKQGVLSLSLPSSFCFRTIHSTVSTTASSTTDAKEEHLSTDLSDVP